MGLWPFYASPNSAQHATTVVLPLWSRRTSRGRAGLCRSCYAQVVHSRARFGGHRHLVLERDGYTCRVCGAPNQRTVHHRRPGRHAPDLLITVCPGCHARIHHLAALHRYVVPALLPFWAEQHPHTALQLQLDFELGTNG